MASSMFTLAMTARPTCTTPKPFAFKTHTTHRVPHRPGTLLQARGVGKDAVGSWLDLAGFVAKSTAHTPFDELADKIGRDCYIDVAGWHLYLKDVKLGGQASMAQGIAQQLGAQMQGQGYNSGAVEELLTRVPVKLGQGKETLSLSQVMPAACVRDLLDICEEYARRM